MLIDLNSKALKSFYYIDLHSFFHLYISYMWHNPPPLPINLGGHWEQGHFITQKSQNEHI